ncbi:MAG: hypothetical protein ACK4GQ_02620, partial [Candidatus Hadarchaeales archaeon]
MKIPRPSHSPKKQSMLVLGILIISLSLLMFEIALTRVFSVVLAYHYVFIVVSTALLGLGIGAVFFRFVRSRMVTRNEFSTLSVLSLTLALTILLTTTLLLNIPYTESLVVYYVIPFVPFFFSGMIFAFIFDRFTEYSSNLYCANLLGSGAGPIAVIFALESFGGVNTILLICVISAVSAVMFALGSERRKLIGLSLIGLLL